MWKNITKDLSDINTVVDNFGLSLGKDDDSSVLIDLSKKGDTWSIVLIMEWARKGWFMLIIRLVAIFC